MLKDYPKAIVTKDGTSILIRPATLDDELALQTFFNKLPLDDLWFLRENLSNPIILHNWLNKLDYERTIPMLAIKEENGEVVGNLRLYRSGAKSLEHIGNIRVMVLPEYRQLQVGSWLILDSIKLAMALGIEKIIAEFISGKEDPALDAAEKLDFHREAVLKNYVKDRDGTNRDLVILVRNLHKEWSDF